MSILKFAAATAVAALLGTGASALTYGAIPGGAATNDALSSGALSGILDPDADGERLGWYGATLYLNAGAAGANITVDYLGSEAGYNNTFTWGASDSVSTGGNTNTWGNSISTLGSFLTMAGQLMFSFTGPDGSVANGSNPDGSVAGSTPNFFVSFGNEVASSGTIAYLFFDDNGAGPDDNHDDMLIRLTVDGGNFVAPVPIPAAGFLLLGGLSALGMIARRRRTSV